MDTRLLVAFSLIAALTFGVSAEGAEVSPQTAAPEHGRSAGGQDAHDSEAESIRRLPLPPGHTLAPSGSAGRGSFTTQGYVHFEAGEGNIKSILVDGRYVWVGSSIGLVRYDIQANKYNIYDNTSGLLSNSVFHVSRIKDEIWIGTYGGGLSIFDPNAESWRNYNIPNGMGDAFIYDVLETSGGDIWIATWSGANRVIGGNMDKVESWELYTVANTAGGLPNDWVYGLAEGRNGEVWLATEGGLARFADGRWDNWAHSEGLGAPYDLVKEAMPYRNDPGQYSGHHARQKAEQGLEDVRVAYNPNYVVALAVGADGTVWVGTWGGGLSRFDGESWRTFTVTDGLPGNHVFALAHDPKGDLWVGSSRGLALFKDGAFNVYGVHDGLYSPVVFSLDFEDDGGVWVG